MVKKKLQVFISSTYIDLIDERQSAVQAVLDAGHIPAGMELFKAGNETQLDTIYKWIDSSDVYMLILGGRYGSTEEKSGKSYTQLEYEYAIKKEIPIFSVVLKDAFLNSKGNEIGRDKVFEVKNNYKYAQFKKIVMSKIIREVDDSKDIMLSVHTTLNDFLNDYKLIGWVRENDTEANSNLLSRINELSLENENCKHDAEILRKELENLRLDFDQSLAFEDEKFMIEGTYQEKIKNNFNGRHNYITTKINKEIFLDYLFLLWAPYLIKTLDYNTAKDKLETAIKDYMGRSFSINNNAFQKIKIQFTALGLIKNFQSKATSGGVAEFISLSEKGKTYLINKSAIQKSP